MELFDRQQKSGALLEWYANQFWFSDIKITAIYFMRWYIASSVANELNHISNCSGTIFSDIWSPRWSRLSCFYLFLSRQSIYYTTYMLGIRSKVWLDKSHEFSGFIAHAWNLRFFSHIYTEYFYSVSIKIIHYKETLGSMVQIEDYKRERNFSQSRSEAPSVFYLWAMLQQFPL